MRPLLIATTNPAKLAEYRILLRGFKLAPISLAEAGIGDGPEEAGATFAENAILKARYYFARCGVPTLADDGGLEIDALGGEPGVRSHRWISGDRENEDAALVALVVQRMRGVESARRTARLKCAMALVWRGLSGAIREGVVEAAMEGMIGREAWPTMRPGFPYRSVLVLKNGRYVAELGEEEEAKVSQRREAIERAAAMLREIETQG